MYCCTRKKKALFCRNRGSDSSECKQRTYSIAGSLDGFDGSSEAVCGDGEVLDKVVEELPVLSSVELLRLGVPDSGVGVGGGHGCKWMKGRDGAS
jgi:hypothetical protein